MITGLFSLYGYVFRLYCLQISMYSVSAQGVVECIISVHYYYYLVC